MSESLEARVAHLEKMVEALTKLNFILVPLLAGRDDTSRKEVAEVLRKLLVSPADDLSPELSRHIVALRDVLVLPIPPDIAATARKPTLRPVE